MFYIRDCNDNIVGNPKGYATFKGASMQETKTNSPAYRAIWSAFDTRAARELADNVPLEARRRNISSIRIQDTN